MERQRRRFWLIYQLHRVLLGMLGMKVVDLHDSHLEYKSALFLISSVHESPPQSFHKLRSGVPTSTWLRYPRVSTSVLLCSGVPVGAPSATESPRARSAATEPPRARIAITESPGEFCSDPVCPREHLSTPVCPREHLSAPEHPRELLSIPESPSPSRAPFCSRAPRSTPLSPKAAKGTSYRRLAAKGTPYRRLAAKGTSYRRPRDPQEATACLTVSPKATARLSASPKMTAHLTVSPMVTARLTVPLKYLQHKVITLLQNELKRYKKLLSPDYPACSEREVDDEEDQSSVREGVLKITLHFLKNMKQTDLANTLQNKLVSVYQRKLKSKLREKCQRITEGISQHGSSALLNEIYTDLYITEGWSGDVNNEHEVRQIETVSKRPATEETPIKCNDLFKDKSIRSVLTKGVAGIGKTVSVQKFILDWAEGKSNQDITFMFPLPFRELNLMKQKHLSLMDLLYHFFPEIKELRLIDCKRNKVVLIFDGLDECRLPLNFQNNERLCRVTESASVDVLLTNLIKGNLLPSALLWITSRPGAANQIPPECVGQVTEIRGFSDSQKNKYFRKRISDQSLANKIITHIKSSRSLYIMCHIPVLCWISASVLERMLGEAESGEIPKTLTQMFTHFLIFQIKHKHPKYQCDPDPQQTRESILALGKLAFQQLEKGNLLFYEEDLKECGIDFREASMYSSVCTQIFKKEFGLHLGKVFSFVHPIVQEFLAALYTFLSFISKNVTEQQTTDLSDLFTKPNMSAFLRCAVKKAIQSKNGHLDLFLRFLLGLSLESNQILLRDLLPQTGSSSHSKQHTVEYIKKKIRENPSPEKSINLFHCLNELNDDSLVQEVQRYLNSRDSWCLSGVRLSPAQWSALVFVLLNSEENLDVFDLRKYERSDECLLRLLPVVKASRKAVLCWCDLTEESCRILSSVLSSNFSSLRELDLSKNKLQDSGVKLLSAGLANPHCTLEILRLYECNLTGESCRFLYSVLRSNSSSLRELDLSGNKMQDLGLNILSAGLANPHCTLEILRLEHCSITGEGCAALVSALRSNTSSHLRKLHLKKNEPGESGEKLLSDLLKDPHCKLETLQSSISFSMPEPLNTPGGPMSKLHTCSGIRLTRLYMVQDVCEFGIYFFKEHFKKTTSEKLVHIRSTSTQSPYPVQGNSGNTDMFTPELAKDHHKDWNSGYRFHCSRAGQFQCKHTNLVFEMKEKAEVLYSIVSWGSVRLDGMGQMQPAGPLYNIDCSEGSMCKLHLPHCEINSDKNQTELAVAHFSKGNVEIIQPLKVTETHVIIDIKNLSLFGLLMKILFEDKPIKAQVLLFYKEIPGRTKKRKLHMHLLPQNVPVIEVQNQFQHNVYIESSSTCQLVPRKPYRPRCEPYKCQPQTEIFEIDSAPNYHPTFEVLLSDEAEVLALGLLDEHDQEVWASRQVCIYTEVYTFYLVTSGYKSQEAKSPQMVKTAADFVDKHRDILIQKVSSVMEIADGLLSKKMINDEMYSTISAAATPQKKMRILYFKCLIIRAVKEEFYTILKEKHPHLVYELENRSSNAHGSPCTL
ncbi:NACHT, LRR and PYD domains-containing protein 12 isoform X3 [Silurus asotus]|uniref:NACHT, LRR and PYD domains-containing protein 12 isoform X3 n=1 Tax=Silurus asotus TaxID=30991 RepID=A0AAD5FN14_SILAS|nr:NACHT, LRR and PYD domains-containing protein 12 isoform X3 [Silurus asotus]